MKFYPLINLLMLTLILLNTFFCFRYQILSILVLAQFSIYTVQKKIFLTKWWYSKMELQKTISNIKIYVKRSTTKLGKGSFQIDQLFNSIFCRPERYPSYNLILVETMKTQTNPYILYLFENPRTRTFQFWPLQLILVTSNPNNTY